MAKSMHQVEGMALEWPSGLKNLESTADLVGIPAARLRELADARLCPHWRIDGGDPWFRPAEVKKWVAMNLLERVEGQSLPVQLRIYSKQAVATSVPTVMRPCAHLLQQVAILQCPPGVYFLCEEDEVVYVGQAVNPLSRISQHCEDKRFDRAYVLPLPESELNEVEGALIRHLQPKYNGYVTRSGTRQLCAPIAKNLDRTLQDLGLVDHEVPIVEACGRSGGEVKGPSHI